MRPGARQLSSPFPESQTSSSRRCGVCSRRRKWGPGSGFRGSCAGECLPFFGCLQSRRPLEARELTLEFEIVPEHRASLESNERNFLSLISYPLIGSIANAIFDAVGVRMTELPITQQETLEALEKQRGGGE